jgi:hypothetical protein
MVSMSIADVECRHSWTNHFVSPDGNTSFHQTCAQFINRESHFLSLAAVAQAKAEATMLADSQQQGRNLGDKQAVTPGPGAKMFKIKDQTTSKQKQARGMSAIHIFRKELLRSDCDHLDIQQQPCQKDSWARVKQEFGSLPADQKALYGRLSKISWDEARYKQCQEAEGRAMNEVVCNSGHAMVQPCPAPPALGQSLVREHRMLNATMISLSSLQPEEINDVDELRSTILDAMTSLDCVVPTESPEALHSRLLDDNKLQSLPVSEECLSETWAAFRAKGLTLKGSYAKFAKNTQKVASAPSDKDVFPRVVNYRGSCGQLCRQGNPHTRIMYHTLIAQALESMARKHGKPQQITQDDILLSVEVHCESLPGKPVYLFAFVTAPSAQSGHHKPDRVYTLLRYSDDDIACVASPFQGLLLTLDVLPAVAPVLMPIAPFDRGCSTGAFRMLVAEELVEHILCCADRDSFLCQLVPDRIILHEVFFCRSLSVSSENCWHFQSARADNHSRTLS